MPEDRLPDTFAKDRILRKKKFNLAALIRWLRNQHMPFYHGDEDGIGCIEFDTLTPRISLSYDHSSDVMTPSEEYNGEVFVVRIPCTALGKEVAETLGSTEVRNAYRRLRASARVATRRGGDEVVTYDDGAAEEIRQCFRRFEEDPSACDQFWDVADYLFIDDDLRGVWNNEELDDVVDDLEEMISKDGEAMGFNPVGDVRETLLNEALASFKSDDWLQPVHIEALLEAGLITDEQAAEWYEENCEDDED